MSPFLSEDAALEDGATADGPADAEPGAPGIGGSGAETEGQGPDQGAAGQEDGAAVDAFGLFLVEAVVDAATHHAKAQVEGVILDGQYFLDVLEVAGAHGPVAAHAHFAELEAGETAGTAQREHAIAGKYSAIEIRTTRRGDPPDIATQRQRDADAEFGPLPASIGAEGIAGIQVLQRHGHAARG